MADPIVAVVTPFQSDGQCSLDLSALRDLLQFLFSSGVRRIVANGTTGEFPALTAQERRAVLKECRRGFPGQVIAHVSSTCAAEVREAIAHAGDHADAVLLLPPYYFADVSVQGVVEFLAPLAQDSPLPVYLYNFPRHTQVRLGEDVVAAIRERAPGVRGLKDSSGNLDEAEAIKKRFGADFEVYLGADSLVLRALTEGLDGSVTGGAQAVPELFLAIGDQYAAGDLTQAQAAQERLDVWTACRKRPGVAEAAILKAALGARIPGFPTVVRPPFCAVSGLDIAALRQSVKTVMAEL